MGRRTRRENASLFAVVACLLVALMSTAAPARAAKPPGPILYVSDRGGHLDLWEMQADGSSPVNLTNDDALDDFPAWSADGRRIAWTKGGVGPEGEIWVMDANGSNARQVTFNAFSHTGATWSPDGRQIAFSSIRNGNQDIYVIDVDGKSERRLTTDPASDWAPDWSPDGTRIAWTSARSGHEAVYTMNADGSDVHRVTPDRLEGGIPGWSPDGTRILFSSAQCAKCAESDLWAVNADGTGLKQITDTPANELAKSWLPDGRSVVGTFSNVAPSEKELTSGDLAVWDVATGVMTRLANSSGSDGHPDWASVVWWRTVIPGEVTARDHELQERDNAAWAKAGGGAATIEYNLPKAGHVRVRVFDEAGREVARPVDEWQPAGRHSTLFAFGAGPNQVFRYRVDCDGRSTSGKIETGP